MADIIAGVHHLMTAAPRCAAQGMWRCGSSDRVGIFGGSYGGYLTLRAMSGPGSSAGGGEGTKGSVEADSQTPVEFKFAAGVAMYGFVHNRWMTLEGGDFTWEEEYLGKLTWPLSAHDQRSDIFNQIHQIDAPLLLIHGSDDDICPPSQSRVVFNSLHHRGVPTGLVLYPNEGHGITNEEDHVRDCMRRMLVWFLATIPPESSGSGLTINTTATTDNTANGTDESTSGTKAARMELMKREKQGLRTQHAVPAAVSADALREQRLAAMKAQKEALRAGHAQPAQRITADVATATERACVACSLTKPKESFSGAQWKAKAHSRRCSDCIVQKKSGAKNAQQSAKPTAVI
jgi:dienelactone hydrolase